MSPVVAVYQAVNELQSCESPLLASPPINRKLQIFSGHRPPVQRREAMRAHWILLVVFSLAPTVVLARQDNASQRKNQQDQNQTAAAQAKTEAAQTKTEEAQPKTEEDGKLISVPGGKALGMSILGNQEAPKALVIVPWKRSELGNVLGISTLLDDSRLPIDKEVFMRMLSYYEIRSETSHPGVAPTTTNAARPTSAAPRRKP